MSLDISKVFILIKDMPISTKLVQLIGSCCGLTLLNSTALQSYEQGSYLIFEMVETVEQQTVENRIPIERHLFSETDESEDEVSLSSQERSEFEVDYSAFGTPKGSAFNTEIKLDIDTSAPNRDTESTFDLSFGSESKSVFGD
jgi:hypothetical protein